MNKTAQTFFKTVKLQQHNLSCKMLVAGFERNQRALRNKWENLKGKKFCDQMRRHFSQPSSMVYISHITYQTVNNGIISII